MTQYAHFVAAAPDPKPVIGWFDTGLFTYTNLPPLTTLLAVTPDQWAARMTNPSGWAVSGGALVPYTPPASTPTLAQQAAAALSTKIAAGIVVTSTGTSSIDAAYALDDVTMTEVGSVARDASAGMGLPGGSSTFVYPDASGTPRVFTATNLVDLYKAMRDMVFVLSTQAAIMGQGGTPVWPTQSATIP